MVDVACSITADGGITNGVVIDTEHVDASVCSVVVLLPEVGRLISDQGADVFNHHGVLLNFSGSKHAQTLDVRFSQVHVLLPVCLQLLVLGRLCVDKEFVVEGAIVSLR